MAYMPNAERKKQYLRIHADILRKNETLVRYLVRLANSTKVAELLDASATIEDRRAQIAIAAMNRWREAGWAGNRGLSRKQGKDDSINQYIHIKQ